MDYHQAASTHTAHANEKTRGLRAWHCAVLCLGLAFLLIDSFHGAIWFDESYSVAIARFSFAEIWAIGSNDVHPVLYYWLLHILYLVFGDNWAVYRVFTVLGAWAVSLLGFTHVRRLFGEREGLVFTFLTLFLPYISIMANQIRMYSWTTFTVMLCALTAFEIFSRLRHHDSNGSRRPAGVEHVPVTLWISFALSSLASAYFQYFGAISVFFVNLFLFVYLVIRIHTRWRNLIAFGVSAIVQIAAYVPWLLVAVFDQTEVVSDAYWAIPLPGITDVELATYLAIPSQISFALRGAYGIAAQVAASVFLAAFTALFFVALCMAFAKLVRFVRKKHAEGQSAHPDLRRHALCDNVMACILGFAVYACVLIAGNVAGEIMGRFIMYYRYLFVAMGPFVLAISLLLIQMRSNKMTIAICASVLGLSVVSMALLVSDDYNAENQRPLDYFMRVYEEAKAEQEVDEGDAPVPLVLSSDIGIEGVTSVVYPDIPQLYMDWQKGDWSKAYECYKPALSSISTWEQAVNPYHGHFVVLGQSSTNVVPRDITDLDGKEGCVLESCEGFWRPYERTYFYIAVMWKD